MKTKRAKNSVKSDKQETRPSIYLGDYYSMKERCSRPVTEGVLKLLTEKLLQWLEDPESLHIREFTQLIGMHDKDYWKWRQLYAPLQEAHEYAKSVIGTRREVMACKRQLDSSMIKFTLYQYGDEYKEASEYHARLAKRDTDAAAGGNAQFSVTMYKVESDKDKYFEDKE
jgi:hypothetical protein